MGLKECIFDLKKVHMELGGLISDYESLDLDEDVDLDYLTTLVEDYQWDNITLNSFLRRIKADYC